jgi:hypothetical protein
MSIMMPLNVLSFEISAALEVGPLSWGTRGLIYSQHIGTTGMSFIKWVLLISVGDQDPDPDVFGPPESGSISQRIRSGSSSRFGSGSFPSIHKSVERTEIMLAK